MTAQTIFNQILNAQLETNPTVRKDKERIITAAITIHEQAKQEIAEINQVMGTQFFLNHDGTITNEYGEVFEDIDEAIMSIE